ncbi:MAG: hypothetical protein JWO67_4660 [Streptosporangiaceae bacterium]|jgi:hypothetical protein|nr:hypothetical protein [Streptosporangiaceae bacterium]
MLTLAAGALAGLSGCGAERSSVVAVSQGGDLGPNSRPAGRPSAGQIFALVKPGAAAGAVLVARAAESQPGGPETLVPVKVQAYKSMSLAPAAVIRVTAPYYAGHLSDWISGAAVTPQQFATLVRRAEARYGPLPDRARMFRVTLDPRGRVSRLQHIFSP